MEQLSPSKGWGEYDLNRAGSRHDSTRAISYMQSCKNEADLAAALEAERAARQRMHLRHEEMLRAARQLQLVADLQEGRLNQQAASVLQQALLDLLAQEDGTDVSELQEDKAADVRECEDEVQEEARVVFEALASRSGVQGRAVLGSEILLWGVEASALEPTMRVELTTISKVSSKRVQISPFTSVERLIIESESCSLTSQPINLDFASHSEGREICERFKVALMDAVTSAKAAAANANAAANAVVTTEEVDAGKKERTHGHERALTERKRTGADLRLRLKEVVSLRAKHKTNEAATLMEAIPDGKMTTGARGRTKELCDLVFTFGGLALTKDIVARFLRTPEVRLLLPEELQQKRLRAKDALVEARLLEAAKQFFRNLMKVKGKTGIYIFACE